MHTALGSRGALPATTPPHSIVSAWYLGVSTQLPHLNADSITLTVPAFMTSLQICEKTKSKPRKIFDAVNKLWKTDAEVESNKAKVAKKSIEKKKRPTKAEDSYKACEYCSRKFCDNAFDRHVEHCK